MDNSTRTVSPEEIGRIAMHDEVKKRAISVVRNKLGRALGPGKASEVPEIAEDALSTVMEGLLNATYAGTTSLRADKSAEETAILAHPVARYLMAGVTHYCDERLKNWSVKHWSAKNKKFEAGPKARYLIDSELADDSDYWDQHLSHNDGLDSLDDERIDSLLLAKGVSAEDIDLIKRNLSGWSFVDLAAEHGGTADKYRRRIQRALDKAGIDPDLFG
jgi:hypothetical protein